MKIALVCYHVLEKYQHQTVKDEDGPLLDFLQLKGLDIHRVVWNDPAVKWGDYDAVVIKAPWDYHEQLDKFISWLEMLTNLGCTVLNPVDVIKWNSDKHYLVEIAKAGLPVISTVILEPGDEINIEELRNNLSTETLVFKPCVSAGAKHTYKIDRTNEADMLPKLKTLVQTDSFLVQEFSPEVVTEGEWSYIFFNGEFSHALVKKPGSGDFRVQHYFGGTIHIKDATSSQIRMAEKYVSQYAKGCLYARVDGIMRDGIFYLMELELIEPLLFLAYSHEGSEAAQTRYYNALTGMLNS
ncbi:MAG TPA: hypothetical protein DCE78_05800 [Bacteroidetes bacterium]|nr:hypothetical protein [Bacteroidota bacterium]